MHKKKQKRRNQLSKTLSSEKIFLLLHTVYVRSFSDVLRDIRTQGFRKRTEETSGTFYHEQFFGYVLETTRK